MTNAEKFEEVFGLKIDAFERITSLKICELVDKKDICKGHRCNNCKLGNFWKKQYRKKKALNCDNKFKATKEDLSE